MKFFLTGKKLKKLPEYIVFFFVFLCCSACSPVDTSRSDEFFDLTTFIESQRSEITSSNVSIIGNARVNDREVETNTTQEDFDRKLRSLLDLDLNYSRNRNGYRKEEGKGDGLKYLKYSLDAGKKNGVTDMIIYYDEDPMRPVRMEIREEVHNLIYSNHSRHILEFGNEGTGVRLQHYAYSGDQKLVIMDPVRYDIDIGIRYPRD